MMDHQDNKDNNDHYDGSSSDEYDETSSVESIESNVNDNMNKSETTIHFLKQHSTAIIIALLGTFITFLNTTTHEISWLPTQLQPKHKSSRRRKQKNNVTLFTTGYHRTRGLNFCLMDDEGVDNNSKEQSDEEKGLVPFDFIVPKEYVDIMLQYYEEDEKADVNMQLYGDKSYECLKNLALSNTNIKGMAKAYIQPDISTFYKLKKPSGYKPGDTIKVTTQSFTNFGAKFYNLSPKAVNLWWDGGSGESAKGRLVGTIQPFECLGTATFPGNSFSFTATFDREVPYERYVVTADDAVIAYDPIAKNKEKMLPKLSPQEKYMYDTQKLNFVFERDYTIKTGRTWLSTFPRPPPLHYMHPADYFGQTIKIVTDQTHFNSIPENMARITLEDYDKVMHPSHRSSNPLELTLNVISCAPRVFEIENFLSDAEIEHMFHLSTNMEFKNSTTNSGSIQKGEEDASVRSSTNAWLYRETSPIIDAIYRRAADVLKIPEHLLRHFDDGTMNDDPSQQHHSIAEAIQFVHYKKDQQYTPHHDFHYPLILDRYQPLRYATILFYLNDDMTGGETVFPKSVSADKHDGLVVEPKKGKAILFYNMLPDGNVDDLSMHGSKLVLEGEKWAGNLWIWDPVIA